MASSVCTSIYTLGGDSLEITLARDDKVKDLKAEVFKHWPVPPLCQKLLLGMTILDDAALLGKIDHDGDACSCMEDGVLHVTLTLAVYVDGALEMLADANPKARRAAVESVGKMARNDYERVTEALCTCCITDPCFLVRQAAEEALIHITRVGDTHVIGVLLARLDLPDCSDRRVVLKTLARIGQEADESETSSQGPLYDNQLHWDDGLGVAVVQGLILFSLRDTNGGILALSTCLEDSLPQVRREAGSHLGRIAQTVSGEGIYLKVQREVSRRLRRSKGMMKVDVLQSLVAATTYDDAVAILSVCQCLEDSEAEVRQAAIEGICKITSVGHCSAVAAVSGRLRHNKPEVREAAQEALRAIATEERLPTLKI